MKKYLFIIVAVLMVACSDPHAMENTVAMQSKQVEVKSVSPTDSVKGLIAQARWGDKKSYIKLADCYREGYGLPKDFFSMVSMILLSNEYDMDENIKAYVRDLPENDEYGRLFKAMNRLDHYVGGDVDSLYLAVV